MRFQQDVGLKAITDGEYRRSCFHIDFLDQLRRRRNDAAEDGHASRTAARTLVPPVMRVTGKVRHARNIEVDNFRFVQRACAPAAARRSRFPRRRCCTSAAVATASAARPIPSLEPDFYDDVARAYGDELRALSAAGCDYVQLDDTNLAYLCDPKMREAARARGDDPDELPRRYADFVNRVAAHKPAGMLLAMHLCRGNFRSTFAASGDYEPVAEALLAQMDIDAYFLEYDDARSGDFRRCASCRRARSRCWA